MNGIDRINALFEKQSAFIGYLTAGDGGINQTLNAALALIKGGVNILELGMPFSDPVADGPVIQRAASRAIEQGMTLDKLFKLAQQIRQHSDIPLILFSYLNPLLAEGASKVIKNASQAGIDGLLLVDCPPEEAEVFYKPCLQTGMAPIFVVAPSTPPERIRYLSKLGRGFLYYACRKGTTGVKTGLPEDFGAHMQVIKSLSTLPVVVGFGIGTREAAAEVLTHANGVVVGSLFVKTLEDGADSKTLCQLAQQINPLFTGETL